MSDAEVIENARAALGCAPGEPLAEGVLRIQAHLASREDDLQRAREAATKALSSAPVVRALVAAEEVLFRMAEKGNLAARLALNIVQPVACEFEPDLLSKRTSILEIVGRGGSLEIRTRGPHWFIERIVESLKDTLRPAPNYCEMRFTDSKGGNEDIIVTLQREGKITPHDARLEAEKRADQAVAELEKVKVERDDLRAIADAATSLRFGHQRVTKSATDGPEAYVLRDIRLLQASDFRGRPRAEAIAEARRLDAEERARGGAT